MKKKAIITGAILVLILAAGGGCYFFFKGKSLTLIETIGLEEAKVKADKFINEQLMPAGYKANIKSVVAEDNLYAITLDVNGKDYTSYMTKDGKKFFQSGIDIEQVTKESQTEQTETETPTEITKSDKPNVELFVMSYCPYGTQMEKGILPVVAALGDKIDFTLKFCDYAMHGEKELNEQLTQYCIQKDDRGKLSSYLNCFLISSDSAACIKSTGLDAAKISNCVKQADQEYKVTEKFNDKNSWPNGSYPPFDIYQADNQKYGVQGSPTLVVNGAQAQANRDSASLLKVICTAFNNLPKECSQQLSSATPSPGFGEGTSDSSGGGCAN